MGTAFAQRGPVVDAREKWKDAVRALDKVRSTSRDEIVADWHVGPGSLSITVLFYWPAAGVSRCKPLCCGRSVGVVRVCLIKRRLPPASHYSHFCPHLCTRLFDDSVMRLGSHSLVALKGSHFLWHTRAGSPNVSGFDIWLIKQFRGKLFLTYFLTKWVHFSAFFLFF